MKNKRILFYFSNIRKLKQGGFLIEEQANKKQPLPGNPSLN